MPWKKANKTLISLLEDAMKDFPEAARKPMFGSPTFFVNGNMFAGVHEDTIILRLSEADRADIFRSGDVRPFTPMGRPMKEYAALPESICRDRPLFKGWLERSYQYTAALRPKPPAKPRK